jgi:MoxR-like ATPase
MRVRIGYPDTASEKEILRSAGRAADVNVDPVITTGELLALQSQAESVTVDDALVEYMLTIVEKTRTHDNLVLGVSPRGAQSLFRACQALAMSEGRTYVLPDDVKRLVVPVFAHRLIVNSRSVLGQRSIDTAERVLQDILTLVDVPV